MSHWWKYVFGAGVVGLISGAAGFTGGLIVGHKQGRDIGYQQGYEKGYEKGYDDGHQEPKIMLFEYDKQGIEGICVELTKNKIACSFDVDSNGSVDVVIYDLENKKVEEHLGKDDCNSKNLRKSEQEKQLQPK